MIANDLSLGMVIKYKNKYVTVIKIERITPGRLMAYVQADMKDIVTGIKYNERFPMGAEVEAVSLESKKYQYQYMDGDDLVLMDLETYEQNNFSKDLLIGDIAFLQEGMEVRVESCEEHPLKIFLPDTVILSIRETESVVKGQTASASYKPAIMENGVRVMVPPFVTSDDKILVKTADSTYVERVKNK